jgi:hypothetical protein
MLVFLGTSRNKVTSTGAVPASATVADWGGQPSEAAVERWVIDDERDVIMASTTCSTS